MMSKREEISDEDAIALIDEENAMTYLSDEEIQSISILRGSFGCPGCSNHFDLDPSYPLRGGWNAFQGDGGIYSGVYGIVHRLPGESLPSLIERAEEKARQIGTDYNLPCRQDR